LRNAAAFAPYGLAAAAGRVLPAPIARHTARGIARLLFAMGIPARARLEANLRRVLPAAGSEEIGRHARHAFENFGAAIADVLQLDRVPPEMLGRSVDIEGVEHVDAARAGGRGVIVLSAHAGNWEWGAALLASTGVRLHIVAAPHANPWIERWFARRRSAWGVHALRGVPLWREAARALRRGEWLGLMGDRHVPGRGSLCTWAAVLAARTGALLLPAVMTRLDDGRYRAVFYSPIPAPALAAGAYREFMRRWLAAAPGQWLAFGPLPDALTG
jgi:KDO2-lipid IV(A) lauroyltransferase